MPKNKPRSGNLEDNSVEEKPQVQKCDFASLCMGQKCRVVCVDPKGAINCRLMELGLTPGTEFTVTKVAPFGDPIEIDVRGTRLCLRKKEASEIEIEQVS